MTYQIAMIKEVQTSIRGREDCHGGREQRIVRVPQAKERSKMD